MVGMAAAMLAQTPVTITSQRDLSLAAWYGTSRRRVLRFVQRSWDPQALAAALMRAHQFRCEDTTPTWFRKTKGRC